MNKKHFYITTTLPYVNADPHVGFAMEIIRADIIARYKRQQGYEVFFNTGTDEHGTKIYEKAAEKGIDVKAYVDENAEKFRELAPLLNLSVTNFIRTTDASHIASAQAFWNVCLEAGDIYKKNYKVKYCVGCELEKTDSELVDGKCSIHPTLEIQIIEEENYFFKFSKYQKNLLELYGSQKDFVLPSSRFHEIKSFVERGLQDFSISRLKHKMPWGIPVPNDDEQVMYVWFDALVNYISAIGWPHDMSLFEQWGKETGGMVQYCGKDNLRQQSAMWQSMLMSAKLPLSKHIIVGGFINSGGQKMSKSIGNVISPYDVVAEYGVDALRYYMAREIPSFEDGDMTMDRFKEAYNANLANGIGNLASRILKMAVSYDAWGHPLPDEKLLSSELFTVVAKELDTYEIGKAADIIWKEIGAMDQHIQETEPFKLVKVDEIKAKEIVASLVDRLQTVAFVLASFLPQTSETILALIKEKKTPTEPLFLRK